MAERREPVPCDHCTRPIVFLLTVWGGERNLRPYEPTTEPMSTVRPTARYGYSKRRGGVIQLEPGLPADSPYLPPQSLVPHHCGRGLRLGQYTELMVDEIDKKAPGMGEVLMGWIKDGPQGDATRPWHERTPPEQRRGIGFRRGLGRKPRVEPPAIQEPEEPDEPDNPPNVDETVD